MTTLAANTPRPFDQGNIGEVPVVASDIVYEGAAVGLVDASGHGRPLSGGDRFLGFAEEKADNSAGAAAATTVRFKRRGAVQLAVSGAVITDVGQPVYATDDDTFVFLPTGGSFIGYMSRFVSAGVAVVALDAQDWQDPYPGVRETKSDDYTVDALDTGKTIFIDTDAKTITLPVTATAGQGIKIVNIGAFGTVAVNISPQAADAVGGPNIASNADKDIINTKATARRGDYVVITAGHADGWYVSEMVGTWAEEG